MKKDRESRRRVDDIMKTMYSVKGDPFIVGGGLIRSAGGVAKIMVDKIEIVTVHSFISNFFSYGR